MPVSERMFHVIVLGGIVLAAEGSLRCGGVAVTPSDAGDDGAARPDAAFPEETAQFPDAMRELDSGGPIADSATPTTDARADARPCCFACETAVTTLDACPRPPEDASEGPDGN
jgi:hypothetical protein